MPSEEISEMVAGLALAAARHEDPKVVDGIAGKVFQAIDALTRDRDDWKERSDWKRRAERAEREIAYMKDENALTQELDHRRRRMEEIRDMIDPSGDDFRTADMLVQKLVHRKKLVDEELAAANKDRDEWKARAEAALKALEETVVACQQFKARAEKAEAAILKIAAILKVRDGEDIPTVAENWVLYAEGLTRRFEATLPKDPELRELALRILGMEVRKEP